MLMTDPIIIYADGSFDPSTETGGWAFAVYQADRQIHAGCGRQPGLTNNTFEVLAVLNALIWLDATYSAAAAILRTDSTHVVERCHRWRPIWRGNGWKRVNPNPYARKRAIPDAELWQRLDRLLLDNRGIEIEWCKGHAGIIGNELVDRLARSEVGLPPHK